MSKTHFEIVEIESTQLTVDVSMIQSASLYFYSTQMARSFNRKPQDYTRLETTQRYIDALGSRYGISRNDLVRKKRGGKYQGTWLHKKLAIDFARWLSADFAVSLDEWVEQRLSEERDRQQARLAARTGYLPMSQAVFEAHDPVKPYHFSNEADLINRIVLGSSAKKFKNIHGVDSVRDALSASQIYWIDRLQRLNTSLIELGMDYATRKDVLRDHYTDKLQLAA